MQEAQILDAVRKALGNFGIASSAGLDGAGNVIALGIGNGKMVSMKIVGPEQDETPEQIATRAKAYADAISRQMAGQ